MKAYKIDDLLTVRRTVSEAMSILQTVLDALYRQDVLTGVTSLEQALLSDLESAHGANEELIRDIDAIFADIPPWSEACQRVQGVQSA